jgi:hypothetical protein
MATIRNCALPIDANGEPRPESDVALPENLKRRFLPPTVERHKDFMHSLPLSSSNDDYFFARADGTPASTRIARSPVNGYEDFP